MIPSSNRPPHLVLGRPPIVGVQVRENVDLGHRPWFGDGKGDARQFKCRSAHRSCLLRGPQNVAVSASEFRRVRPFLLGSAAAARFA